MTSEELIFAKIKILPPNLKEEALHFIEFLETKLASKPKRLISLGIEITSADIDEARKEMWANFPRDEFYSEEQK